MRYLEIIFEKIPRSIAALLLIAMVLINFANVIGRKLLGQAIFWSEEVMLFMLIWAVFLGAVAVTYGNRHLRMDLFSARLAPPWSYVVNSITVLLFIAVAGFMIRQSVQVVQLMNITGQVSNAAKIPMVVLHLSVPVGFAAMILAVLVRLRIFLAGKS